MISVQVPPEPEIRKRRQPLKLFDIENGVILDPSKRYIFKIVEFHEHLNKKRICVVVARTLEDALMAINTWNKQGITYEILGEAYPHIEAQVVICFFDQL